MVMTLTIFQCQLISYRFDTEAVSILTAVGIGLYYWIGFWPACGGSGWIGLWECGPFSSLTRWCYDLLGVSHVTVTTKLPSAHRNRLTCPISCSIQPVSNISVFAVIAVCVCSTIRDRWAQWARYRRITRRDGRRAETHVQQRFSTPPFATAAWACLPTVGGDKYDEIHLYKLDASKAWL